MQPLRPPPPHAPGPPPPLTMLRQGHPLPSAGQQSACHQAVCQALAQGGPGGLRLTELLISVSALAGLSRCAGYAHVKNEVGTRGGLGSPRMRGEGLHHRRAPQQAHAPAPASTVVCVHAPVLPNS